LSASESVGVPGWSRPEGADLATSSAVSVTVETATAKNELKQLPAPNSDFYLREALLNVEEKATVGGPSWTL